MVGQGYAARIDATGKVEEITGLDTLLKALSARLNLPEGPARAAAEKTLAQQLAEPNVRSQLQLIFSPYPDHPVAIGESWYRKNQMAMGFPLTLEATYTLKGRDTGIATIEVAGRSTTAANAIVDAGQLKVTYELHGDLHGQIQIEESTGWPLASTTTQSLAGSAAFHTPGSPAQIVPITAESTMTSGQN
jgi:hypothetical protein